MSDPLWKKHWPEFETVMKKRLSRGYVEYGDDSFDRPALQLVAEVEEEILDVIGWSFMWWVRMQRVKDKLAEISNKEDQGEV